MGGDRDFCQINTYFSLLSAFLQWKCVSILFLFHWHGAFKPVFSHMLNTDIWSERATQEMVLGP